MTARASHWIFWPLWLSVCLSGCAKEVSGPRRDAECAACHASQALAHGASAHARSDASPVFEALLPRVEEAWGREARARCEGCHAPVHSADGHVACVSCHAAAGNTSPRDGALVVDLDAPLAGPLGSTKSPHGSREGAFLRDAALCVTCHEVTGPELFVEPTGTEHEDHLSKGGTKGCLDCHLPALSPGRAALGGPADRPLRDHAMVGLSPAWGAPAAERATRALAAQELLAQALSLEAWAEGGALRVRLTNVGAGHAVPTGATLFREVWVAVEALDASGGVALTRGVGSPLDAPLRLGATLTHEGVPVLLPTQADAVELGVLAPREAREAAVVLPLAAASARVRLLARAVRPEVLEALVLGARAEEVPLLVARELVLPLGP